MLNLRFGVSHTVKERGLYRVSTHFKPRSKDRVSDEEKAELN